MKILIPCFCLLGWLTLPGYGQQTLVSGGGTEQATNFSVEWSLGDWLVGPMGNGISLQYGTIQSSLLVIPLSTEDISPVQFSIYPNPTVADVVVQLHQSQSTFHYRLLNLKGEQLKTGLLKAGDRKLTIELLDYTSGIYHLVLTEDQGQQTYSYKIVKNQ